MRALQLVTSESSFFAQQVNALERAGVDCTVVSVPSPREGRSLSSFAAFYRHVLREVLSPGDYDIVHANYGLLGPLALAQPVRPVVLTLWGSEVMGYSGRLAAVTRAGVAGADAVVAPSRAVADRVGSDTDLVPFGVDTETFRPIDRETAREELGWDPDRKVVLFPYDPDREVKNHPRAARVVTDADVDATLRWISDVPHDRVPLYMNASDAVLVTSKRESGPMVVKEAAACNVPVVSTDVGFAREVLAGVRHSTVAATDRGLIDGLERALEADTRADGRDQVDHLGLERMADGLCAVYQREIGHREVEA